MIAIELDSNKTSVRYQLPGNWNELNAAQLLHVAAIIHKEVKLVEGKIQLVLQWLNKPLHYRKYSKASLLEKLSAEDMYRLSELSDFIFKENTLTQNLFPKIGWLYGPSNEMRNLVAAEFAFTETYYLNYKKTNDVQWLNKLAAVLYRRRKWYTYFPFITVRDVRRKFDDVHLKQTEKRTARWSLPLKTAILLYYEGCRNTFIKRHPTAFNDRVKEKSDADKLGFAGTILSLAGSKFGDMDKTEQTLLWTIGIELERCAILAKEQEEEIEKIKNKK